MELKHRAFEFTPPTKPSALELRLRRRSLWLGCRRIPGRFGLGLIGGDVKGDEVGCGGVRRSGAERGDSDLVAENGVGFEVIGGRRRRLVRGGKRERG